MWAYTKRYVDAEKMIELLRRRRSVRQFRAQKIDQGKIETLVEAALRSPTSRNLRPWEFIFVDDPALITELARAKQSGSAFLAGAPLAVVVLADESRSDVWIEDCSIASIILQLTAQSLGLGSCWVQIRNRMHNETTSSEAFIRKLFNLPKNMRIESIIGMGYPAEEKEGIPVAQLDAAKIHINRFL